MRNVGFPDGLRISRKEISGLIGKKNKRILNALLIVFRKDDNRPIGECKLGQPDENRIAETDIKLLPELWGKGYGTEIKRGLVSYLFENTDCRAIKATPNINNIASQRMQERVGARKRGEGIYRFPPDTGQKTCDVSYFEYLLSRDDWQTSR